MSSNKLLTGEFFMNGDAASAEGALSVGCRFFAGYPITPATEIAERMAERLPEVGGTYIQMEDEIASIAAILGGSSGGAKSMTATSGPGFSLMMENIGLGAMMETPCVIVDVQRAGPSTGLPTLVAQGDIMQARWGSHGCYSIIALCPSSPQEMFDMTVRAFNLSEKYRTPVLIMADESVGHMSEKVKIPHPEEITRFSRRKPQVPPEEYWPYTPGEDLVPTMANAGEGYRFHTTGLTHDERGYPIMTAQGHEKLVRRLIDKIEKNKEDIIEVESTGLEDADVVVCSYGISARIAKFAVDRAREDGIKAGMLRLKTIWPFPEEMIRNIARNVQAIIVPEINNGQIALEVERCAGGAAETILLPGMGGAVHHPQVILEAIRKVAR
jgi:2-oxoglutarate ferredoxin oxidoreductase subunit alpha